MHLDWINTTDDFIKDKVNVTLFRGINFDVQGHLQIKDQVEKLSKQINLNNTSNNDENKKKR